MAKGDFHRIHAHDREQHNRRRIAQEAARLISEHGLRDYRRAKLKAARHLGIADEQALPRNHEIEQALREHQRLFLADSQPRALQQRREAAVQAMQFLAPFRPRLVGPVLDGTADEHSAVRLHLFCDAVEDFSRFLDEHRIPARQQSCRLWLTREQQGEFPLFLIMADGLPFDLVVLPPDVLRQAPLDATRQQPMVQAGLATVQALLEPPETRISRLLASARPRR